jgi:two-component system, OmpR family, phosphate regulon sensor histidine kinase PhoR
MVPTFQKMKSKYYRILIRTALVALTGLLAVQIYWFVKAYDIQEKQFDQNVVLALRNVTDQLLKSNGEPTSQLPAPRQTASNAYFVEAKTELPYVKLDSLIRITFERHNIYSAFNLAVYDHTSYSLLFGNYYDKGIRTEKDPTCLDREQMAALMDFSISFPEKRTDIVGAMNVWIFTAFTFLLVLVVFGFLLIDLSRQKKLAEVKADFLNNMTHELQTPIANIALASEVLRKGPSSMGADKVSRYIDIIHDENQRLKFHTEQVLQLARMERGEIPMNKKPVDVNELITEVVEKFRIRLQHRSGQIVKDLQASKPALKADPFHLANIFYNLLDNADKYSPESPDITITTQNKDHGILITIADKGMGIKREAQKFIFDKFYRASSGNQHDVKGFGLGLTYVQEIVKAHGGEVTVSSEENCGSQFDLFFQTR